MGKLKTIARKVLPRLNYILTNSVHYSIRIQKDFGGKWIKEDLQQYTTLNKRKSFAYDKTFAYFIAGDKFAQNGSFHPYFWQDLWAAKHIFQRRPHVHCDIGSRVDGFIAHLASFGQKVRLFDIRPMESAIDNVEFVQCDATNLENIPDGSIESISALCSLEHFGLGRYGDPIDPEACFKCFHSIQKKIQWGGVLYLSVPIGYEHVEFNAHRVFYAETIVNSFPNMRLVEFSVAYKETIEYNVDLHQYDGDKEYGGGRFGLFLFEKL